MKLLEYKEFLSTLADVVDTGMTHTISFELRKLKTSERSELSMYLRHLAQEKRQKTE